MVVEQLQPDRLFGQNPLFQAVMSFNASRAADATVTGDLAVSAFDMAVTRSRLDLEFHVFDRPDNFSLELCYSTDLFEPETAARILDHFERLLVGAVSLRGGDSPSSRFSGRKRSRGT